MSDASLTSRESALIVLALRAAREHLIKDGPSWQENYALCIKISELPNDPES